MMNRWTRILGLAMAVATAAAHSASAGPRDEALLLGDSVAFGYIGSAGHEYINPENFVGFADYLEPLLQVDSVDAACPGETSGSFVSAGAADNGCRAFRAEFPLHIGYQSTQLQFALGFLRQHPRVRLVTITLGANDGFLLEDGCASQANPTLCIEAGVPAFLAGVERNLQYAIASIRSAGFGGTIIVTNYYSTDYSDPQQTGLTLLLNQALAAAAAAQGARVADLFSAFQEVAANPLFAGKTCNTGLLNASVQDPLLCDVHPSQSGHRLIAQTIARSYRKQP